MCNMHTRLRYEKFINSDQNYFENLLFPLLFSVYVCIMGAENKEIPTFSDPEILFAQILA